MDIIRGCTEFFIIFEKDAVEAAAKMNGRGEAMDDGKDAGLRVGRHPVLGELRKGREVLICVDGRYIPAREGEPLAAALFAAGVRRTRYSRKRGEPRGPFCMVGRCTECLMTVDGKPNVRTCITPVREGMRVETPGRSDRDLRERR